MNSIMTTDRRKLQQTWCIEAQHSVGMIPEEEKRQNTSENPCKSKSVCVAKCRQKRPITRMSHRMEDGRRC